MFMRRTKRLRMFLANKLRRTNSRLEQVLGSTARAIYVDYAPNPVPRYGHGKPPHPELFALVDARRDDYKALLTRFGDFETGLSLISASPPSDPVEPYWCNGWIGGTNAIALYCLPAMYNSRRYVEIGSGNSTKFVRRSIKDNRLSTRITSIDPHPRAEIDAICDEVLRCGLEDANLSVFKDLVAGDIIVLDGSHRCFQNSDVAVFFLEVLPRLPKGVIIYIDDIYLPYDYPPEWTQLHYSEQYMLASMLLTDGGRRYEPLLPNIFVERDLELAENERQLWQRVGHPGGSGNGFLFAVV